MVGGDLCFGCRVFLFAGLVCTVSVFAMEEFLYEQLEKGITFKSGNGSRSRSPMLNERRKSLDPVFLKEGKKMKVVDFEKERRAIDLEMKRQEEIERKLEQKRKAELSANRDDILSKIAEQDLRFILEKSREVGNKNIAPPSFEYENGDSTVNPTFTSERVSETIPGFDHSRLGIAPSSADENRPLNLFHKERIRNEKSQFKLEELAENFKRDCDTVAFVTQMLINENPALEQPLVEALNGVLQKVRRKHTEILPR